eukprot:gnl/TRDRNA2_/TRDRNA2_165440_c0_seq1.p1 gnl/TRDRNA2_/TRDRNA2_165440_c0~~gnl/TRDRNA2_/TRDRNA2_165440_c0_seq1.p1  ORF type:complete len:661 (+),score=173.06 gnl/TRDRNA2_/TRDRNA2_165440_c0_seq1:193-1983(+)
MAALREGMFQLHDDDIHVGVFAWDLAKLQRECEDPTSEERDGWIIDVFKKHGFEPVAEMVETPADQQGPNKGKDEMLPTVNACPRVFLAEQWHAEQAYPILYKFTHQESFLRVDLIVYTMQWGKLWDFADGGAETSSGWKYTPFSPQPVEFEKTMTFTMPATAVEEHFGPDWHIPKAQNYVECLAACRNRCQVLRVHPFDLKMEASQLPPAMTWEQFRPTLQGYRQKFAEAMIYNPYEPPKKELDLFKIESKPMVLFHAAGICKTEGNELLQENPKKALEKYEEGIYIVGKCREVLLSWRLLFRQMHLEKAKSYMEERGLKSSDLVDPGMPKEFRADEEEELNLRKVLLLNSSLAAMQLQDYALCESRASRVIEEVSQWNVKARYRRAIARLKQDRREAAISDLMAMLRATRFGSKEATSQLLKLMTRAELDEEILKMKKQINRERKVGALLINEQEDERISIQEERYQRFLGDCEQRRADKQREITFDEWARQYEWRYDAEERAKNREQWPEIFNYTGAAPLPVEEWEVDYLTHKEIDKIVYHRQTQMMAERKGRNKKPVKDEEKDSFICQLEYDPEDGEWLKAEADKKGYHYWW